MGDLASLNRMCTPAGQAQLGTVINTIMTAVNNAKTVVDSIRSILKGDYLDSDPAIGIGSTPARVANAAFEYYINGVKYNKAAVTAGSAFAGTEGTVPISTAGGFAMQVDAAGAITYLPAPLNVTPGYASAALALAAAQLLTPTTDKVIIGYITVLQSAGGTFVPGTTDLDDATCTDAYTDAASGQAGIDSTVIAAQTLFT